MNSLASNDKAPIPASVIGMNFTHRDSPVAAKKPVPTMALAFRDELVGFIELAGEIARILSIGMEMGPLSASKRDLLEAFCAGSS